MRDSRSRPSSFRASDADRERALRLLRDSAAEGRLSHETFVRRVDLALRARDLGALHDLLADLPGAGSRGLLAAVRTSMEQLPDLMATGGRTSRLPLLRLPGPQQPVLTIGRDPGCDLVLADRTVSRLHAVVRLFGDQWFLDDLGSTNGTRLNGLRIRRAAPLHPGDRVGLGAIALRVGRSAREPRRRFMQPGPA
jgi:hypothetical protein